MPYWLTILHQLLWGFRHLAFGHGLYAYYLRHHALGFLRSGIPSGSGGKAYLYWLAEHGRNPRDW